MGQTHTPGPWTIKQATSSAMVSVYAGGFNVACTGSANVEEDNADANARLIAAAPELLEACREALNMLGASRDHCTGERGLVHRIDAAAKAAHAAIRKAEGGAA